MIDDVLAIPFDYTKGRSPINLERICAISSDGLIRKIELTNSWGRMLRILETNCIVYGCAQFGV